MGKLDYQDEGASAPPITEKRGPNEPRSPSSTFLGADEPGHKATAAPAQAKPVRETLRDDERLKALGSPYVVIETLPWQVSVVVVRPPWGYGNLNKLFLGRSHRSAERYALELFDKFCEAVDARNHFKATRKAHNRAFREIGRMLDQRERDIRK